MRLKLWWRPMQRQKILMRLKLMLLGGLFNLWRNRSMKMKRAGRKTIKQSRRNMISWVPIRFLSWNHRTPMRYSSFSRKLPSSGHPSTPMTRRSISRIMKFYASGRVTRGSWLSTPRKSILWARRSFNWMRTRLRRSKIWRIRGNLRGQELQV